jgi:hypothetical protein
MKINPGFTWKKQQLGRRSLFSPTNWTKISARN